jgi:hypothetical protein
MRNSSWGLKIPRFPCVNQMNKSKCSCTLCKQEIFAKNISLHYSSKSCLSGKSGRYIKLSCCKYCSLDFSNLSASERANHSRWCDLNPRSHIDREKMSKEWGDFRIKIASEEQKEKIRQAHRDGKYKGSGKKAIETRRKNDTLLHTAESIEKIRNKALMSTHQRKCKRSHEFIDKRNRKFIFDSHWEDALALRLDELDIFWIRPDPIKWIDHDGKSHNYFPDFYLPDHNLYLDPKNSYAEKKQSEKLSIVAKQINLIIIRSLNDCKNFGPPGRNRTSYPST